MCCIPKKIIIADDHPLFRQALLVALNAEFSSTAWIEAETADTTLDSVQTESDAELLLLDLNIPGANGFDLLIRVKKQVPDMPVVVISAYSDDAIISKAMQYGAAGFVPKSASVPTMLEAIKSVLSGNQWWPENFSHSGKDTQQIESAIASLTSQEYRILMMFSEGLLNKQIGDKLCVAEATVKAHASAIFRKLNVRNRTQAAMMLGQLDADDYSDSLKD